MKNDEAAPKYYKGDWTASNSHAGFAVICARIFGDE